MSDWPRGKPDAPRAGAGPAVDTRPCVNKKSTSDILSNAENDRIPKEISWESKSSTYAEQDTSTTFAGKVNVDTVSTRDQRRFFSIDTDGTTVEALYDRCIYWAAVMRTA